MRTKDEFQIGFGCYLPGKNAQEATQIIDMAMQAGYRYFDTASLYETERSLGEVIKTGGVKREDLFIASKAWIDEKGYQNIKDAFYRSIERLGVDYLDAYLIHWPKSSVDDTTWKQVNCDCFRAMQELSEEGLIKYIGTSNFLAHHLDCLAENGYVPAMNQLELHPGYMQEQTLAACQKAGIIPQAWSPLGRGALLENEYLQSLGKKYGKSLAQISLIYLLQRGVMPIVKSSEKNRMLQNLDVFDVTLEKEDLQMLSCMPQTGWTGEHPDFVIPTKKSNFNA